VSGANPVKWALVSFSTNEFGDPTTLAASSTKNLSDFSAGELGQVVISSPWNSAGSWSGQSSLLYPGNPQLIATSDANSFTSVFGTDGFMAAGFPVSTEGSFGSTLAVLQGDYNTNALTQLGSASLSLDGLSLILAGASAPVVPIPAAVILFGTGLAGLVGVARRRMVAA
jgi:hypothetical protein